MGWFQAALVIHVLAAVLGVGQVAALAIIATDTRRHPERADTTLGLMTLFSRLIQWALLLMLLSGIELLRATGWVYMRAAWFIVAFVLFIAVGAVLGAMSRPLRKSKGESGRGALPRIERIAWLSCAMVVVIVALMVTKP